MKLHHTVIRSITLAGLFLLAVSFVSPAQAREIWLNPTQASKKPFGTWGAVPLKKGVNFNWHIPTDFALPPDQSDNATLLVIGLKDGSLTYRVRVSVSRDGLVHDAIQNTAPPLQIDTDEVTVRGACGGSDRD